MTLLVALAGVGVGIGMLVAPLVRSFAFPAAVAGYSADELTTILRATLVIVAFALLVNGYLAILRGLQRSDIESLSTAAATLLGLAVTLIGASAGWRLWALVAGEATQVLVAGSAAIVATHRLHVRLRLTRIDRRVVAGLVGFGGFAFASQVSDLIDTQWDRLVLSRFVGSTAVTAFTVATSAVLAAKLLALLPLTPLLTSTAELSDSEPERMEALYATLTRAHAAVTATVLSVTAVLGPAFIQLWIGAETSRGGEAVRLFAVAIAINLWVAPLATRILGSGRGMLAAAASAANVLVNGFVSFTLTMTIGFRGALLGSIAGNAIAAVLFLLLVRARAPRFFRFPRWRAYLVGLVVAVCGSLVANPGVRTWPSLFAAVALMVPAVATLCLIVEGIRWNTARAVLTARLDGQA
jgi:O-antigen/teichoic acid export membrane protein